jgi:hypothetical protein
MKPLPLCWSSSTQTVFQVSTIDLQYISCDNRGDATPDIAIEALSLSNQYILRRLLNLCEKCVLYKGEFDLDNCIDVSNRSLYTRDHARVRLSNSFRCILTPHCMTLLN